MFMNRIIQVDREQISLDPLCSVFVGNLPFKATEDKVCNRIVNAVLSLSLIGSLL